MNYQNVYKCDKRYLVPNVLDQDNKVSGEKLHHLWSNVTGYGNIKISNGKTYKQNPWNRIPPLSMPTSTLVNIHNAWNV